MDPWVTVLVGGAATLALLLVAIVIVLVTLLTLVSRAATTLRRLRTELNEATDSAIKDSDLRVEAWMEAHGYILIINAAQKLIEESGGVINPFTGVLIHGDILSYVDSIAANVALQPVINDSLKKADKRWLSRFRAGLEADRKTLSDEAEEAENRLSDKYGVDVSVLKQFLETPAA